MRLRCENCGKGLLVKETLAGKRIKCPACQHHMTAPSGAAVLAAPATSAAPVRPASVFISYVEEDSPLVRELVHGLELAQFHAWHYQRDCLPGSDYLTQTGDAIERAQAVVLLISPHSLQNSNQITIEVVRAHECGKPFLPILRGVSHAEFQRRQPVWRQALGASTSIAIPAEGLASILPKIIGGLQRLCGEPTVPFAPASQCPACASAWLPGAIACMDCGYMIEAAGAVVAAGPVKVCPNAACGVTNAADSRACERCATLLTPDLLYGRYRIEKTLQATGIRTDYLAVDTRTDQKVVLQGVTCTDPREFEIALALLQKEAALRRLLGRHPLLPRVFDVLHADQSAHLIVEHVAGRDLKQVLDDNARRPFPFGQVVAWGKTLCELLERMHSLNPPHVLRALKPEVLVLLDDQRTIKLTEFGQAAGWGQASVKVRVFTESYAPPEQIMGHPEPRSDLFALAGTLYELATGQQPEGVWTGRQLDGELRSSACSYAADQRWFWELICKSLAERPEDRSASAAAFKAELQRMGRPA